MNEVAKILKGGARQLVELPDGFEINADEVVVRRDGPNVVLEGADEIDEETGLPIEKLRAMIQEAIDSGPAEPWDAEAIKREMRARLGRLQE